MYCAITDFKDFQFLGDLSLIKENIVDYNSDMEKLIELSKQDKDLVIKLPHSSELTEEDLDLIYMLSKARDNIRFMVRDKLIADLPCFFQYGFMSADSLDRMETLCEMGVTDVYITGELGFKMKDVKRMAEKYGVKTRIVPNIAQLSGIGFTLVPQHKEHINSFWVRPDDLHLYEEYIDIVEFLGDSEKQHIFYKIYFQDKRWNADLSVIVAGLEEVYGCNLTEEFTKARLNCGKKCLNDLCHTCFKMKAQSLLAAEHGINIKKENLV